MSICRLFIEHEVWTGLVVHVAVYSSGMLVLKFEPASAANTRGLWCESSWAVLLGAVVEVSISLDTEVRRFESKIQALALFALTLYLWAPLQLEQFMSLTRSWDSLVACITWQNEVMSVYWSEFNKIATLLKSLRNNRPQKMLRVLERLWKF